MQLTVEGRRVHAETGGVPPAFAGHVVVLVHGAGNDHSVWDGQTSVLAGVGLPVVAVDLPGHDRSDGPPAPRIEDLAAWVRQLLDELGVEHATLVGHSMGSLVALATAAAEPRRTARIGLIGTSARMAVNPDLQRAADARDPAAVDMIVRWSHGRDAASGGGPALTRALLEANLAVLGGDLSACQVYDPVATATETAVDALVVNGDQDRMTPADAANPLARALGTTTTVVTGGSHALPYEAPEALNAVLVPWLARRGS